MSYEKNELKECISIDCLYTIHYFEYTSKFYFSGESHDFWEFIFVDKGSVDISEVWHPKSPKALSGLFFCANLNFL